MLIAFEIDFIDLENAFNKIDQLDNEGLIDWSKFSQSFMSKREEWDKFKIYKFFDKYNEKIDYVSLCKNPQFLWDSKLLEIYKNQIDWNSEIFYSKQLPELKIDFINKFRANWNWRFLGRYGLKRKDVNLDLLEYFRSQWVYTQTVNYEVSEWEPDRIKYYSVPENDSIFNNAEIKWFEKSYKYSFAEEIEIYMKQLIDRELGYNSRYSNLMFERDFLNYIPY